MRFGWEHPATLAALALLAPLAWLWLRRRRRPPATVSSLVLWRRIARPQGPRRERRLPPLFVAQALLLAAGATALAGPFLARPAPPGPTRDAIVVLDVSASMQAKSAGGSRFDAAREAAVARARELGGAGRKLTVVAAGSEPRVLGAGLDGERAARLLEAVKVDDVAGNTAAAVEFASAQAGPDGTVDLFTDLAPPDPVLSRDARAATTLHRFGEGGANLAIAAVRVDASPFDAAGSGRVLVTVRSFADAPRAVEVELAPLDPGRGPTLRRRASVPPRTSETAAFDDLPWTGAFAARLVGGDDLPLDDRAYGWFPPRRTLRVVLVGDDPALAEAMERLLREVEHTEFRTLPPAEWRPDAAADVTIFDGFAPPVPPPGNVAYLAPRQGNPDVTVGPAPVESRLAETRDHALLRGVQNPATLLGGRAVGLAASPGLQPIMVGRAEGRATVLAAAGGEAGRRVVATAFPLRPHDLRDPDALPSLVFTLNLVRWLSPAVADGALVRTTGERVISSADEPITRITAPDGSKSDLTTGEGFPLDRAGVYRVLSGSRERPLLVGFADPGESDVRRPPIDEQAPAVVAPERTARPPSDAAPRETSTSWVRPALLGLLGLMLAEWLLVVAEARGRGDDVG
jgi:Ca-activated chloride channel homolog